MTEIFELELLGGDALGAYRAARPEVEAMPWGTLDPTAYPSEMVAAARRAWTGAAFQELRTGAACAATLRALFEARAPLDLVAVATRFPLDELVHVELCSRVAMELGGAIPWVYDPNAWLGPDPDHDDPLVRAAHLVVTFFCVGEAASIPLLHGVGQAATHPLPRAVLRRIVRDEADHGRFGWQFLDWALPHLGEEDVAALGATADSAIRGMKQGWRALHDRPVADGAAMHDLGWIGTDAYLRLAQRTLQRQVLAPLRARGVPLTEDAEGVTRP